MPFVELKPAIINTDTIERISKSTKVNSVYGNIYYLSIILNSEGHDGRPIKYPYSIDSERDKDYDIIAKHLLARNEIKEQPPNDNQ